MGTDNALPTHTYGGTPGLPTPSPDDVKPLCNRKSTLLGVLITFGSIAIFAVIFRIYARFKLQKAFGWDDFLVILSLCTITLGSLFLCLATFAGLGDHMIYFTYPEMKTYLFRFYIANGTYALSTALLKCSLLCQYLRIFERGPIRWAIWIMLAICTTWGIVTSFLSWVPCMPVHGYWDRFAKAKCYAYGSSDEEPFYKSYVAHGVLNMVFDFLVLVLPSPMLFRRALTKREKMATVALGSLGFFVIVSCAWKLAEVVRRRAGFYPYFDPSWWSPIMVMLAALEVDMGILAVSCPVFWPIIEEHVFGVITVQQEVEVTSMQRIDRFHSIDDDGKSDHGSEAALASDKPKKGYYTEELTLEPFGKGESETSIKGKRAK